MSRLYIRGPVPDRFWPRVDKYRPATARVASLGLDACWLWLGAATPDGYGQLQVRRPGEGFALRYAHHVALFVETGRWPELFVLHRCDNPSCVRFGHLFEGTNEDNVRDAWAKGRAKRLPLRRGEDSSSAKLTEDAVRFIRQSNETGVALAKRFGVAPAVISSVRHCRTWKHVK